MSVVRSAVDPDGEFRPDPRWWSRLFSVIDAGDATAFCEFLTPDAIFRFGNVAPVVGSDAIRHAVGGFFAAIACSRHRLIRIWEAEHGLVGEGEVTYTRHDRTTVTIPFVNVFELQGDRIRTYSIYIDVLPLFSPEVTLSPTTSVS